MQIAASRSGADLPSHSVLAGIAATLASLAAIAVGGRRLLNAVFRLIATPFRWFCEQAAAARQIEQLARKMNHVCAELTTNGGSSLKDAVGRIDKRCAAMEEGLAAGGQRVRALLTDVPDGAFELDAEGSLIWSNRTFCKLLGRQAEELLGRGWEQAVASSERANVIEEWDRSAKVGREMFINVHFVRPDATRVYLQIHSYPIRNVAGKPINYIARCYVIPPEEGKA